MTLQITLSRLTELAAYHSAYITTVIKLEAQGGATLQVFWEGDGEPREGNLYFGLDRTTGNPDSFISASAIDPRAFIWGLEEGLDDEKATDVAVRFISTIEDVERYFLGQPYASLKPQEVSRTGRAPKRA